MRTNLIMQFYCAECGHPLHLVYPGEDDYGRGTAAAKPIQQRGGDPTGGAVRYVEAISVRPCMPCIDKHTGPAKALSAAVKALASTND